VSTGDHGERDRDVGWVLWSGTIGFVSPLAAGAAAASAAGYDRLSVSPLDVLTAAGQGVRPAELGRRIRGLGLQIVLDAVMNWYGGPRSDWPFGGYRDSAGFRVDLDEVLRMSEAMQVVAMNAVGQPTSDRPLEELAQLFGRLCDRAADLGAQVTLEFMPMLAIDTLAVAWSIVSDAGRDNGGLMFDTWHFFRGDPDFATLETIPAGRIFMTQISDGAAQVRGGLVDDTFHRLMPGDGSFELDRAIRALDRIGGLRWAGPEVISPTTAAADPGEVALAARKRVADLIGRNRPAASPSAGDLRSAGQTGVAGNERL
jgi:sugar phosphate isomerase/epimerase